MSHEVELPPYPDEIKESPEIARLDVSMRMVIAIRRIHLREIQLRESLSQIATLTAQVDGLKKDKDHWYSTYGIVFDQANEFKQRGEKAEAELATANRNLDIKTGEADALAIIAQSIKAELASLREGATVTYRVEVFGVSNGLVHDSQLLPTTHALRMGLFGRRTPREGRDEHI